MRRNRPRLILAVAMAATLISAATAEMADRGVQPAAPETRQAAHLGGARLRVGGPVDAAALHPVTRPGLYGMSEPPAGSRYGIVAGQLIRYDPATAQVLSIIRQVDRILD